MTYRCLGWDDITVPTELPEVIDEIDFQRVVMNPGATWDYFPGHYDPDYARRHGHPTIFLNTMHIAGFVDRIATDWAGPYSRVVRRKVSLLGSIYAGDSMVGRGRVVDKHVDTTKAAPQHLVNLEIAVYNQREELCCPAEVSLLFPPSGQLIDGFRAQGPTSSHSAGSGQVR
jgi:acyl dehydratase